MSLFTFVLVCAVIAIICSLTTLMGLTWYVKLPRQIHRVSHKQLPSLPIEILTEILSYLEWDDLLHIRQTCHRLRKASRSKSVWLALVKRYIATAQPRPLWPEKPLGRHSRRELELLVVRWKRIKMGWATDHIPRPRHFFVSDESSTFISSCMYLVEGGRWLLVGTRFGCIQYYDLNAVAISASTLIPSPFDGQSETQISVDMDSASESLTFHIGVSTRRRPGGDDPRPPQHARWIQVWRVTTEIDSNGHAIGLAAEIRSSFREEYEPACISFRLRGQLVAYSMFYSYSQFGPFNNGHKIIIVNWKTRSSSSLNYSRKIITDIQANWLALLPGERLLCYTSGYFLLFDLANAPTTTLPSQYPHHTSALMFTARCPIIARAISQPFFIRSATRLTLLTRDGVKGMTIPNDVSELYLIDLLRENISGCFICMSYSLAAVIHLWPTILILQYAWPDQDSYSTVSRNTMIDETITGDPSLYIDPSSGRVVISGNSQSKQYILEPNVVDNAL